MAQRRRKPWEVDEELWHLLAPLLPQPRRRFRYPGRRRLDDRLVLQGILFVLHTGIGWEHLPKELGPSLPTSGETLTIEESMTLRAWMEHAEDVGDEQEWSWRSG